MLCVGVVIPSCAPGVVEALTVDAVGADIVGMLGVLTDTAALSLNRARAAEQPCLYASSIMVNTGSVVLQAYALADVRYLCLGSAPACRRRDRRPFQVPKCHKCYRGFVPR